MTALSPPPNWYLDPSGRHESRYWDGFTWTPHVADRGQPGLDPLVRTDPIAATAPAAGSLRADPIGPGTEALRTMATVRPESAADGAVPDPRIAKVTPIRRRSALFDVTAVLAVVVVVVLGGYVLWQGWRTSDAGGRPDARGAGTWSRDGYRLALPPSWVETTLPPGSETSVDAAFQVIDAARVVSLVGDEPTAIRTVGDADGLVTFMTDQVTAAAAAQGTTATVLATDVAAGRGRFVGSIVADLPMPQGVTVRMATYVVVQQTGSVTIMLLGDPQGVDRHREDASAAADSVRFR